MSKQTINIGASPNDGTGTPLRTSFDYTNQNFTEIYTALGGGVALPGATTQVIFNDGGTNLAGDAGLVYNKTTDALTVAGLVTAGSATITGDLTVRTNKLAVTSTGVGCGTATPGTSLEVWKDFIRVNSDVASGVYGTQFWRSGAERGRYSFDFSASLLELQADGDIRFLSGGETERYRIDSTGISTWSVAGTTAMTLNSTGLGIGVSPGSAIGNLQVGGSANANLYTQQGTDTVRMGVRASGRTGILFDSSNATYTNRAWYLDNVGSSGSLIIGRQGLDVITFDNVGNVGVGITPSAWATSTTIWRALDMQYSCGLASSGAGSGEIDLLWNAYYDQTDQRWEFKYTGDRASRYSIGGAGVHAWYNTASTGTANNPITWTQAMTLDASGNLLVGQATVTGANADSFVYSKSGSYATVSHVSGTSSGTAYLQFLYNNTQVGTITQNGTTGVLYNITSDYRLKESVIPLSGGLARVNALKPSSYNWKSDGSTGEGFLAHELAEVVPFAVSGEKDAMNADGTIKSQGIDMSRIVPILVAAIKELTTRVQTLEAR